MIIQNNSYLCALFHYFLVKYEQETFRLHAVIGHNDHLGTGSEN